MCDKCPVAIGLAEAFGVPAVSVGLDFERERITATWVEDGRIHHADIEPADDVFAITRAWHDGTFYDADPVALQVVNHTSEDPA